MIPTSTSSSLALSSSRSTDRVRAAVKRIEIDSEPHKAGLPGPPDAKRFVDFTKLLLAFDYDATGRARQHSFQSFSRAMTRTIFIRPS